MQVTQTLAEGLKREFQVVVSISDLEKRMENELETMKGRANIAGFRPGKVPVSHLRRIYGRQLMADVVQNAVTEANKKIVEDNDLKLALEPQIKITEDKDAFEKILTGKADLELSVAVELLPKFELADHGDIALEREVVAVEDKDIDEAIHRMAEGFRPFTDKGAGAKADPGDKVKIDFLGKVDGAPFEGGKGEGHELELGSNQFIPGFEQQLVGAKAGEDRLVNVTFPADYSAAHLAGKDAVFEVKVHEVAAPGALQINDDLAKQFNMESLDKLKEAVSQVIERDYKSAARRKVKRHLLDALDAKYDFDLPPTLLDQEFNNIWMQVEADMKASGKSFEDEGTTEEDAREEYRKIARRRVRLGLVLAEIGERAKVQITDDEVSQALIERARQFPGQEKAVWEYYKKNNQAMAEIRAPIFEDKVVDQLLGEIKLTDKPVSKAELLKDDTEETAGAAPEKPKAKAKPKKKAAEPNEDEPSEAKADSKPAGKKTSAEKAK